MAIAPDSTTPEAATMRAVTLRIVPFLMVCYFVAFVDRVNSGFAALQMNQDVGLSSAAFGLGGGLFFIAYVIFEVPSNLAMEKVGARLWLARIMISWGLVSACMAFVVGPWSFYLVRVLLGAAEAGFFPGVIFYLMQWFLGLRGWQWLFILEAAPAVLLGIATLVVLSDGPASAKWLPPAGREWLSARLAAEHASRPPRVHAALWRVLFDKNVLLLALIYAAPSAISNALSLWQPQIIKSFGLTNTQTGLVNGVPFGLASIVMLVWAARSDRSGERVWNTALPLALAAVSLVATIYLTSLSATVALLSLALIGTYAIKGPFWALSSEFLGPAAAAAGLAQINALGNLGAFGGSYLLGVIKDETGSFPLALLPLVALATIATVAVLYVGRSQTKAAALAARARPIAAGPGDARF